MAMTIRLGRVAEREMLEELQRRASLNNPGDRQALLENPDAIELPVSQPTSCCFAGPDLSTLFVTSARHGLDAAALARNPAEGAVLAIETGVRGTPSIRFAG